MAQVQPQEGIDPTPLESHRITVSKDGVWVNQGRRGSEWVSIPFAVEAKTVSHQGEAGRLIVWLDDEHRRREIVVPLEHLLQENINWVKLLTKNGFIIKPKRTLIAELATFIATYPVQKRLLNTDRCGWNHHHDTPEKMIYVTGTNAYAWSEESAIYSGPKKPWQKKGTLEGWQKEVASLSRNNPLATFVISTAFTGPLMALESITGGGFHLCGDSSTGKTTLLNLATSVWGPPKARIQQWRTTASGLESIAIQHNDNLLALDEISQIAAKEVGQVIYMLANGSGKIRSTPYGSTQPRKFWRTLMLSTGELRISDYLAAAQIRQNAGQEIRAINIPVPADHIQHFHHLTNRVSLVRAWQKGCHDHHGHAGSSFLQKMTRQDMDQLKGHLAEIKEKFLGASDQYSPQVGRVAHFFSLVAAAGELAAQYQIVPWPQGEAFNAVKRQFHIWLNDLSYPMVHLEDQQILAQVKHFIEQHGESRFGNCRTTFSERNPIQRRAGFYELSNEGMIYYILPEVFKRELCAGFSPDRVIRTLQQRGWLLSEEDNALSRLRTPDTPAISVYAIRIDNFI
ncbi:DUF927 domain-containing protein [Magnetococcales bacterium HHB-1]